MTDRSDCRCPLVVLCLAAVALTARIGVAGSYEETTPFVGVRHVHRQTAAPRLLDIHVVEIDPTAPGIDFLVTPSNGAAAGETVAQTTRAFVDQHQLQLAVNASFNAFVSGANRDIEGLAASNGDVYSEFQAARLVALNVSLDRVATIIQSTLGYGVDHAPDVPLHNAVGGDALILADGINMANQFDTSLHPRTAAGVTADGKIILMTVDGRNAGHSLGVTTPELGELMRQFGAADAINLDGGGSTTLVFADSFPRVVNVPVGVNNVPGTERSNGNNFGVFATTYTAPTNNRFVFSDFASSEAGHFSRPFATSPGTEGVLASSSAAVGGAGSPATPGSQRLIIRDDPASVGSAENPNGWFVRHVSGAAAAPVAGIPEANTPRPAVGVVGLWARTDSPNVEISLALDVDGEDASKRAVRRSLVPDGNWRRYEWNLQDPLQWQGGVPGQSAFAGPEFTLDSVLLFGRNADAVVYLDDPYHETRPPFAPIAGDFDRDGDVDDRDFNLWQRDFTMNDRSDADGDGFTAGSDFLIWQQHLGRSIVAPGQSVPEPCLTTISIMLAILARRSLSRKAWHL